MLPERTEIARPALRHPQGEDAPDPIDRLAYLDGIDPLDHTREEWVVILLDAWPKLYGEPPKPLVGSKTLNREMRVKLLRRRRRAGLRLWNEADILHGMDAADRWSTRARRGRNGSVADGELCSPEDLARPEPPDEELSA